MRNPKAQYLLQKTNERAIEENAIMILPGIDSDNKIS